MEGYKATVREASRELSARERIKFKDITGMTSLDHITNEGEVVISPISFAVVDIHNENSDNKDYTKYVIEDKDGTVYATGSESFWKSFIDIWDEMADEDEDWSLRVYKKDSNNYKGKQFITCSIV